MVPDRKVEYCRHRYRWIDVRGWNTNLATVLAEKYSLPHTIAYDAGVTQAARFEMEEVGSSNVGIRELAYF